MEKGLILSLFGIVFSVFLVASASALFMGLTDGYIKDTTGAIISGASVSVTVSGCSGGVGNGCSGTDTSDINGYYIVNNLNLPKLGTVVVSATDGSGTGSNSGIADNTQVAHVNVTVCYAPSAPSITPVPNGDDPDVTFYWTSGTDPNSLPTTDSFRLDGSVTSPATSPRLETGLTFTSHSWDVRTCNSGCCSAWTSDSFTLTCPAPSAPSLTAVPDSHSTSATLTWTSGTDPHGRLTHDNLDFDGSITSSVTSPQGRIGLSFASHTWKIETCNSLCCSGWASDSFNVGNGAPSEPTNLNATSDNATGLTALSWDSGIDPELDAKYDELQFQNGTVISNPATSPVNVPSELLIKWRVRTCDTYGACSSWVTADSVTCSQVTTSAVCPTCTCTGGGGGNRGSLPGNKSDEAVFTSKKVELFCNGIPFSNQTLLRVNFGLGSSKKINLYGANWSLEDLSYCPWCYNGIKDFDEVGIDCGGTSCRPCTEAEIPQKAAWNYLMGLSVFVLILLAIYLLYKTGVLRKIFLRDKYYGT